MNTEHQSLREAHKDLTATRILDAAIGLLETKPLEELTIAGVARHAGVTERTVYRHFSTRDDLITALWPRINDRAARGVAFPKAPEDLAALPERAFPAFEDEEVLMRSIIFTRQGQALRLSVNDKRQASFLAAVSAARPDLAPAEQRKLAALVQLLGTSFTWISMKDYWDIPAAESSEISSEAIRILLEQFGRKRERNGA